MLLKSDISELNIKQQNNLLEKDSGLQRELFSDLNELNSQLLVITGVRRCGLSLFLNQLIKEKFTDAFYLNFQHPRLYAFEKNDFQRLDDIIKESNKKTLFFDEIQTINEWEAYIGMKLDEGFNVIITTSNTLLLNKELGTKLVGRYTVKELFPFSYEEFCQFMELQKTEESLVNYMNLGGFPEYIVKQDEDKLNQLFDDILVKEIAMQFGVRDIKTLKRLAQYLISNIGFPVTGNKLRGIFEIGATSTVMEYLSYMEYAHLLYFVPKFSYSVRVQRINARKVYAIDTGLVQANVGISEDKKEQLFENLIFLHLRRKYKEIYYFAEKGNCDFVVFYKGNVDSIVQACYQLNQDNLNKELDGIFEALEYFDKEEGIIVTLNQSDKFVRNGRIVKVIPAHEYL